MDSVADDGVLMEVSSNFFNVQYEPARMVMDCTYKSLTLLNKGPGRLCWIPGAICRVGGGLLQCKSMTPPQHTARMHKATPPKASRPLPMSLLSQVIFSSRWLQLPLYLGLIAAQMVYVGHFLVELFHLIEAALGNQDALAQLVKSIGYKDSAVVSGLNETIIMLVVLALIDVVMISNLLIMVIVGGYETFVSRMNLDDHPDQPEWLSHVNASVLKVKLATAIIGISSIHLLKTFINAANYDEKVLMWQTIIHVTFLLSAMAIAYTDRLMAPASPASNNNQH
jgi:uncharacterized protein (TIGR00645 family)